MIKKYLLLLISIIQFTFSFSQDIPKGVLAGLIFDSLFDTDYDLNTNPAVDFPNPFIDLQEDIDLFKKLKILSYLDYGDGQSPFMTGLRTTSFFPYENVTRGEALMTLIEAWDIPTKWIGTIPFNDIASNSAFFGYVKAALDIGIIDSNRSSFNPYDNLNSNDLVTWISILKQSSYHPVSLSKLSRLNSYFIPNNYQPETLGYLRGINQGVFNHYAKNSFVIPDRKFNLNFSHYYSTQLVELPETYFPIKPLGRGWTHTYNTYIIRENNVGVDGTDYYYIKWADGSIHIFNEDEEEYETLGVYDTLEETTGEYEIIITKKNQMKYYFDRFHIPGTDKPVYYLEKIQDRNGNNIELTYEESDVDRDFGRLKSVIVPSGKKLNFFYHSNTDLIDYIKDPINRKIRFTYNEERLKYFYDAKNQETKYYYLSNDEDAPDEHQYKRFLLKRVRLPQGNSIKAKYDDNDDGKLREYQINEDVPTYVKVKFDYNNTVKPITAELTVPTPTGSNQIYNYEFDTNGMVTQFQNSTQNINISYPNPTSRDALIPNNIDVNGLDVDYNYDDNGNITSVQVENNEDEDFWYDSKNNLIRYRDENGNNTYFNYDLLGRNLLSIKDALGNSINLTYDLYGQVKSITNQEGITVNYTYEKDGAVKTITAPEDLTSSFSYDGINRLLHQTINGQTSSITYDPNDNIKSQTNTGGLTTTFNYDKNDNPITITNANGINTSFSYNNKDQVTSETFGSLVKQYKYNDDGTLDKYIKPSGDEIKYDYLDNGYFNSAGTIKDVDYYDNSYGEKEGLIKSIASDDIRYNLNYNNLNRLDKVDIDNDPNQTIYYSYDNVGNITRINYPDSPFGFYVQYKYDSKNRLVEVQGFKSDGTLQTLVEYTYLKDDRLHRIFYHNEQNTEVQYSYDNAGRLTKIEHLNHNSQGELETLFSQEVVIDNKGNITSDNSYYRESIENEEVQNFNLQDETYAYNGTNHITKAGDETLSINDDGNTIQKGAINFQYDIDDKIINITGKSSEADINFQFKYDAYGNRIEKNFIKGTTNPETRRYIWDIINNNVIKEYNPNGSEEVYYVYGVSGLEVSISPTTGDVKSFYHGDMRGSVVFKSDTNGDVIANHFNKYDDFGNITTHNNSDTEALGSFAYLGKHGIVNDVTTYDGLYYIKARYYDAKLGRFLTQDPIWSTNLYPYSGNNPISRIDKNGKCFNNILADYDSWNENFMRSAHNAMFKSIGLDKVFEEGTNDCGKFIGILSSAPFNVITKGAGPIFRNSFESIGDLIYGNTITSEESLIRTIDQIINLAGITGARASNIKEEIYNLFKDFNVTQRALDSSKVGELINALIFEIIIPYHKQ